MTLPVAILAGGLGVRLGPITEHVPKALVEVAGKPFLCHQLEYLRQQQVRHVVLCLGHLGDQVEALVGDGATFGLTVHYSWDGPRLVGTAGALRRACHILGDRFLVLYGDSYLPIDFQAVERNFIASGKPALMTVLLNRSRWDTSNVLFRDGRIVEFNKRAPRPAMEHIDYGLGALSASALRRVPTDQPCDLADVYHELSLRGELVGHEVFERFYEIGSQAGLEETTRYLS